MNKFLFILVLLLLEIFELELYISKINIKVMSTLKVATFIYFCNEKLVNKNITRFRPLNHKVLKKQERYFLMRILFA